MKPKVIGTGEKAIVYAFFGAVDAAQLVFVEAIVVGTIIDVVAAVIIFVYGSIRKLWTTKKLLILVATFVGEAIPLIDAFPFWVGDVWNIYSGTISPSKKAEMDRADQFLNMTTRPLNEGGMRMPRNPNNEPPIIGPANNNGVRRPGGGLTSNPPRIVDIKAPVSMVK